MSKLSRRTLVTSAAALPALAVPAMPSTEPIRFLLPLRHTVPPLLVTMRQQSRLTTLRVVSEKKIAAFIRMR